MPHEIAWTCRSPVRDSRYAAARFVGVVSAAALRYSRVQSFQASQVISGQVNFGNGVCSMRFSGMKWFVATTRMPRFVGLGGEPRPTSMCDCMCDTSGWTSSMILARVAVDRPRVDGAQPVVQRPAEAASAGAP